MSSLNKPTPSAVMVQPLSDGPLLGVLHFVFHMIRHNVEWPVFQFIEHNTGLIWRGEYLAFPGFIQDKRSAVENERQAKRRR